MVSSRPGARPRPPAGRLADRLADGLVERLADWEGWLAGLVGRGGWQGNRVAGGATGMDGQAEVSSDVVTAAG